MSEAEYVPPEVTAAGPGTPEVAVIGGVHGDEPCGVQAVRRLRAADLDLRRGVLFIVANPAAVAAGRRFLDADLNRVFPGDPHGDQEHRLAAELCGILGPVTSLSIHGTRSRREPFALVHRSQPDEYDLAARLPIRHVVDHSGVNEGTITTCGGCLVEVEVGIQGTEEAADAAEFQARSFLQRVGALPGEPPPSDPAFFHMKAPVPKPPGSSSELFVENFELIPEGTVYARVDGHDLVADEAFYPVLMSETGYTDILGYKGGKLGDSLAGVPASWLGR